MFSSAHRPEKKGPKEENYRDEPTGKLVQKEKHFFYLPSLILPFFSIFLSSAPFLPSIVWNSLAPNYVLTGFVLKNIRENVF